MKLLRYGAPGEELPGLLDETETIRSLKGIVDDIDGHALRPSSLEQIARLDHRELAEVEGDIRLGPCVAHVGKIVCIGLNYADHAAESGSPVPAEPLIFMKATSSIVGPYDDLVIPRNSEQTDWEVELGIVIGQTARYIDEASALDHVAGYCVVNDVSERSFQKDRCGQWTKGKSCDTFGPIGPYVVTRDEVPDPQQLGLWTEVDGHRYQDGSTSTQIFPVAKVVSYLSEFMSLLPGDIISTGTPPGVGMGQDPPVYLKPGQVVRLGVDGLGEQQHRTVSAG